MTGDLFLFVKATLSGAAGVVGKERSLRRGRSAPDRPVRNRRHRKAPRFWKFGGVWFVDDRRGTETPRRRAERAGVVVFFTSAVLTRARPKKIVCFEQTTASADMFMPRCLFFASTAGVSFILKVKQLYCIVVLDRN